MYEWVTIVFFTYLGFGDRFRPYSNAKEACLADTRNVFALQRQELPTIFGKDTEGRTIIGGSGQFRFRVVDVKCEGEIKAEIVEPKEIK